MNFLDSGGRSGFIEQQFPTDAKQLMERSHNIYGHDSGYIDVYGELVRNQFIMPQLQAIQF